MLRIPIAVPPGPGGLAPQLDLAYSSQAGDGPFGVGWRLPLGEIRCSARFGVPDYAACAHYELDGQLLVEDPTSPGRYHTLVESFQRVVRDPQGMPDSWAVTLTNGTTLRYGTADNGRIAARPGGPTARWLLREIEDAHGNRIDVSYDRSDTGTAYPGAVTYASGFRRVEFVYEDRPDELHDFEGGIERFVTKRLREIRVTSGGAVFQRRVFGYAQPGDYAVLRSRLAWTQLFGTDCPTTQALELVTPATAPLAEGLCTPLPAQEYDYTDTNVALTSSWAEDSAWAPPRELLFTPDAGVDQNVADSGVRFADVDGDGRVDFVRAYCTRPNWPCDDPGEGDRVVYLNTGSGWRESPEWSEALRSLAYAQPSVSVQMSVSAPDGISHACGVSVDWVTRGVVFSEYDYYMFAVEFADPPQNAHTHRPQLSWQLVDLDGDGLADLVTAEAFGGIARRAYHCDGTATGEDEKFVPGAEVRAAFRNTGRPETGWVRDDSLAEGLPLFSTVVIDERDGTYDDCRVGNNAQKGGYEYGGYDHDNPCMTVLRFHPVFVELDGDPEPELIALEPEDRTAPWLHRGSVDWFTADYENDYHSRAWDYRGTGVRGWQRAAEFDLYADGYSRTHTYTAFGAWDPYGENMWGAPLYTLGGGQWDTDYGVRFADLNRDGLTDVLGNDWALVNRGAGDAGMSGSAWCASWGSAPCADANRYRPPVPIAILGGNWYSNSGWGADPVLVTSTLIPHIGDLNGDGWVDLYMVDPFTDAERVWLQHGAAADAMASVWQEDASGRFVPPRYTLEYEERELPNRVFVDINGDGITDVLHSDPEYHSALGAHVSSGVFVDLIREQRNGRGGTVEFAYASAVAQQDDLLERDAEAHAARPDIDEGDGVGSDVQRYGRVPVVTRTTFAGEHVAPETTRYRYARPRFDLAARKALGFRLVEATRPDGSSLDTYTYQHLGRAGRLSEQTIFDESGEAIARIRERWQLVPDPGAVPGSIAGVRLGRLVQRATSTLYDGVEVFAQITSFVYDDSHGYDFVGRVIEARGTNVLVTARTPKRADTEAWLVDLPAEKTESAGGVTLSREAYTYTPQGRLAALARDVRERGAADTLDTATTRWAYDAYGNVTRRSDTRGGGAPDRVVEFCYDGDAGGGSWCPSFAAASRSHSLRVGVRDPLGGVTAFQRNWASGALVRRERRNEAGALRDATRFGLDAFGRVLETWYRGPDAEASEVRMASRMYQDAPAGGIPAFVEVSAYVDASPTPDTVTTATYLDGFGRTLRTVEETPSGWRGVALRRDPAARSVRQTYPVACVDAAGAPDPHCSQLTGAKEPALLQERDALGRLVRTRSPDGTSLREYLAVEWTQPAGPGIGALFTAVRVTDANGHVTQRLVDGNRVVRVDECHDAGCVSADRTFYIYEATGEISAIYDAVAFSSGVFAAASRALRYHYDTLGRVIQTDDADAGSTTAAYDHVGNVTRTTNARGQTTRFAYDGLDRVTHIDRPEGVGEWDLAFAYDPIHRQRSGVTTPQSDYADRWLYDAHGRVSRQVRHYRGTTLVMDFAYDLLGRPTKIDYPNAGSSATYVYDGAYLEQVCRGDDFCSAAPERLWISDVVYDALGRRSETVTLDGTLTREYYEASDRLDGRAVHGLKRLALTAGDAAGGLDFRYAYDPLGNVTRISDASTRGFDASAVYTYDARNRLDSWTDASGATQYYAYDTLGNLVGHGLASPADPPNQTYDAQKPHQVRRNRAGDSYAYDADGNVARRGAQHLRYDSANRLICAGAAEGDCSHAEYRYDADGALLYESAFPRILMGELFDWRPASGMAISNLFAFGEKIGYERESHATLRSAWLPAWPLALPPALGVGSLAALAGLALLAWLGAGEALREHPAAATLALALAALLVAPPPAGARSRGRSRVAQRLFFRDHLGSLALVTDPAGPGQWRHSSEPFGKPILEGTGWTDFTGKRLHAPTDLHNFGARWYDAEAGRFASVDPVVAEPMNPQALNGYSYVLNDPVNHTDPTGMVPRDNVETIVITAPGPSTGDPKIEIARQRVFRGSRQQVAERDSGGLRFTFSVVEVPAKVVFVPAEVYDTGSEHSVSPRDRRSALSDFAGDLSDAVAREEITSLEALARIAELAASFGTDGETLVNDLGATLSGTTTGNVDDPMGAVARFDASGFRPEFRDPGNQVRHFTAALVAGARFGWLGGQASNTVREVLSAPGARSMADVRLGNAAARLGASLASGRISPGQLGGIVRSQFGVH